MHPVTKHSRQRKRERGREREKERERGAPPLEQHRKKDNILT